MRRGVAVCTAVCTAVFTVAMGTAMGGSVLVRGKGATKNKTTGKRGRGGMVERWALGGGALKTLRKCSTS